MTGTIVDVPGITVGQAEDPNGRTGCTVVLCTNGAVGGVAVRGAAPGTRETDLLAPTAPVERVHAIVLCGGSAFGLDAAGGVMEWLREREIGYPVGEYRVPIVCAAVLFDLTVSGGRHPDRALGYRAAERASAQRLAEGNAGAGAGASVGKVRGMEFAMKGGLGSASLALRNGVVVGAIVAVKRAGLGARSADRSRDRPTARRRGATIGAVATNARLTKAQATTLASCAHDALARTIAPAHTQRDGDTVFALSTGELEAPIDLLCV